MARQNVPSGRIHPNLCLRFGYSSPVWRTNTTNERWQQNLCRCFIFVVGYIGQYIYIYIHIYISSGWWFQTFFDHLPGEMIQFDYFWNGLKPTTSHSLNFVRLLFFPFFELGIPHSKIEVEVSIMIETTHFVLKFCRFLLVEEVHELPWFCWGLGGVRWCERHLYRFGCHYPVLLGIIASHYKDFPGSVSPFLSYFWGDQNSLSPELHPNDSCSSKIDPQPPFGVNHFFGSPIKKRPAQVRWKKTPNQPIWQWDFIVLRCFSKTKVTSWDFAWHNNF